MERDKKILDLKAGIQESINALDRDKIHVLYFSYKMNFHNFFKYPLLLPGKILNLIKCTPSIDHVAHISRFVKDGDNYLAKVFEATLERGMEENDLFDKLKIFQGTVYAETLGRVDKVKAREFESLYYGVPYSKHLAALSGIDFKFIDRRIPKRNTGGFCSWLTSLFLMEQGIDLSKMQGGNPLEITPTDLFLANIGPKIIFFKN